MYLVTPIKSSAIIAWHLISHTPRKPIFLSDVPELLGCSGLEIHDIVWFNCLPDTSVYTLLQYKFPHVVNSVLTNKIHISSEAADTYPDMMVEQRRQSTTDLLIGYFGLEITPPPGEIYNIIHTIWRWPMGNKINNIHYALLTITERYTLFKTGTQQPYNLSLDWTTDQASNHSPSQQHRYALVHVLGNNGQTHYDPHSPYGRGKNWSPHRMAALHRLYNEHRFVIVDSESYQKLSAVIIPGAFKTGDITRLCSAYDVVIAVKRRAERWQGVVYYRNLLATGEAHARDTLDVLVNVQEIRIVTFRITLIFAEKKYTNLSDFAQLKVDRPAALI